MSIEIRNLAKHYGKKVAVQDLTLTVKPGMVYAFLGPNGAGKTTTIKCLTGLLKPTRGTVKVAGYDVQADGIEARKLISYVPDQPFLYEKLTGREFLEFIGSMYKMNIADVDRKIGALSEQFGTKEYLDDLAEGYSHGMRQRLVISAAMLHDPKVLIVDEPMVGLDPRSAKIVKDAFRERANKGVSVFMSTHTLSLAEEAADVIGIINRGQMIFEGTVGELRTQGNNASVEDIFLTLTDEEHTFAPPA